MIEIKITDPHLLDAKTLKRTSDYLLSLIVNPDDYATPTPTITIKEPVTYKDIVTDAPKPAQVPPPPVINPFTKSNLPRPEFIPSAAPPVIAKPPKPIAPGVDLDVRGMPWDSRIHARTKTKVADGSWKVMRGIDPEKVKAIEIELMQSVVAPAVVAPTAPAVVAPTFSDPLAPATNDFPSFMAKVTSAVNDGRLTTASVNAIVKEFGLPSIPVVATRPDLIPGIMVKLDELLGAA
jgi:hypothetical protein